MRRANAVSLRPKLPRIPEEMRQWSDHLLQKFLGWPDVSSRPMFSITPVYRGNAIFGVLPPCAMPILCLSRTRALMIQLWLP